jgi:hypothetical protein
MKIIHKLFLIFPLIICISVAALKAQVVETIGHSVVNGGTTGASLSTAIWMVNNDGSSFDIDEFSFGVGAGLLGGIGLGIFDAIASEGRSDYALKGTLNLSRNRSGLVLMDTFYGTGAGLIISGAVSLMQENRSWDTIREGAGIGTLVGFGFGLVDALVLAKETSVAPSVGFSQFPNSDKRVEWALAKTQASDFRIIGSFQFISPVSLRLDLGR